MDLTVLGSFCERGTAHKQSDSFVQGDFSGLNFEIVSQENNLSHLIKVLTSLRHELL